MPNGLETPGHFIFSIVSDPAQEKVGAVWLAIEPRAGFAYDLIIFESLRRRGYAERAMMLLEGIAREKGA